MNFRQKTEQALFRNIPLTKLADIADEKMARLGFVEPYRYDILLDLRYAIIEDLQKNGLTSHFFNFRIEDYFDSVPVENIVRGYLSSDWYRQNDLIRYHVVDGNPIARKISNSYFYLKFALRWFWVHRVKRLQNPYINFTYREVVGA